MSNQSEQAISLTHAPDGVNYKLLELPAELLSLLECADPPTLKIESSSTSAFIKSGEKSWSLRQKNTSNALMLLSPSDPLVAREDLEAGLDIIATLHDTIELVMDGGKSAVPVARGKWHEKFAKGR